MFSVTLPSPGPGRQTGHSTSERFSSLIAASFADPFFPAPVHYFYPVPAAAAPALAAQLRTALVREKLSIAWLEAAGSDTGVEAALTRAAERFLSTSPLSTSMLTPRLYPGSRLVSALAAAASLGALPVLVFHPVSAFSPGLVRFCTALSRGRLTVPALPVPPVLILLGTADPETVPSPLDDQLCFWPPDAVSSVDSTGF